MSVVPSAGNGKVTVPSILQRKSGVSLREFFTCKDYVPYGV